MHAYLCGHDHVSEHLRSDGVEYFVVGAGSMADSMGSSSAAALLWYGAGYSAFGSMTATESSLVMSFVNADGQEVYAYTLGNPNQNGYDISPTGHPTASVEALSDGAGRAQEGGSPSSGLLVSAGLLAVVLLVALLGLALFSLPRARPAPPGSPAEQGSPPKLGRAAPPDSAPLLYGRLGGFAPEERPHEHRALSLATDSRLLGRYPSPDQPRQQRRFSTFA